MCPKVKVYLPHPLFLMLPHQLLTFQSAVGMGHSGCGQQLLWAGLFPSLGFPKAVVVRSVSTHTRHLHTDHSS